MAGKLKRWRLILVAALALLAPTPATAGYFFGEWSCWWWPARDCPRGQYSPCHYWTPELYVLRSCFCPSNLEQCPPGPFPPGMPTYEYCKYCCPATGPIVSSPYANPAAYYGRQVLPK